MKNNVLITGGSHAEIPLIDALHRCGFTVISTGTNRDGLGHKAADIYEYADFSDREAMLRLARKYEICGVIAGCNDFAYLSASYVAEQLGLGGFDEPAKAEIIHHKDRFRQLQKNCGVRYPRFFVCRGMGDIPDAQAELKLPVVVKPTDLTGGKGVAVCNTWEVVNEHFSMTASLSRQPQIIIEEFISGKNHGTSMLLKNGEVVFSFFDNEEYFKNRFLVSGAYSPSNLTQQQKADVISQVEMIAQHAKLCDGLFHCQFIVSEDGLPYLIDPCRRAPGDLYVMLVSYATGIDYPMAIVKAQLGRPMDSELSFERVSRAIARECIMAETNGLIQTIEINPEYVRHIIAKTQWLFPGDRIENFMTQKAGIVFFEYSSPEELKNRMSCLRDHMRIKMFE